MCLLHTNNIAISDFYGETERDDNTFVLQVMTVETGPKDSCC